jgi:L-fuculose-phosphate aldolase
MDRFEQFKAAGEDLYRMGLVDGTSGSISVREGNSIYVTKKNAMLGHLKPDDIIEVQLEGEGLLDNTATKDIPVHKAIYRETAFTSIISANPPYAIALSLNMEGKISLRT